MSQHASAPPNGGDAQHDMYAAWLASQQNPAAFGDGAFGHYPPPMPPPPQDGQFPMPPFPPPFPLPPFPPQAFGYGQPPAPTQEPVLDSNGKQRALYIGNLDPRVNEVLLLDLFATAGEVINVKIVPDRNVCLLPLLFPLVSSWLMTCFSGHTQWSQLRLCRVYEP